MEKKATRRPEWTGSDLNFGCLYPGQFNREDDHWIPEYTEYTVFRQPNYLLAWSIWLLKPRESLCSRTSSWRENSQPTLLRNMMPNAISPLRTCPLELLGEFIWSVSTDRCHPAPPQVFSCAKHSACLVPWFGPVMHPWCTVDAGDCCKHLKWMKYRKLSQMILVNDHKWS